MPNKIQLLIYGSLSLFVLFFYSCTENPAPGTKAFIKRVTAGIDDQSLLAAEKDSANWLSYGRNYNEDRYSPGTNQ
jgi:quinohemoprotein ethanol dehydrogenase